MIEPSPSFAGGSATGASRNARASGAGPGRLASACCERFGRLGPGVAFLLAAAAALPGLALPFLSDDWGNLVAAGEPLWQATPFGYFRPLYVGSLWLDRSIWGLSPAGFHLTGLLLIAATAALVVVLLRRYTGEPALAALAGSLFALHPYHVENAAWIAARGDVLYALAWVLAALSFDRWREHGRRLPFAALALHEVGLLAKETAVTLPPFLLLLALIDRRRRPTRGEWLRGHLPLWALTVAHFALLRGQLVGSARLELVAGIGPAWVKKLAAFAVAAIAPAPTETIESRPWLWGGIGLGSVLLLAGCAVLVSRARPRWALGAVLAFAVLVGPSLVSFQARYLFLPAAAAALLLADLLRAAGRRAGSLAGAALLGFWLVALGWHWSAWIEAARASEALVRDLVRESRSSDVDELLLANVPHRVRGIPVAADLEAAVVLGGGRSVAVHRAAMLDYPSADTDALAEAPSPTDPPSSTFVEVRLRIEPGPHWRHVVLPASARKESEPRSELVVESARALRVRLYRGSDRRRAAYYWTRGRLIRIF